MTLEEEIYEKQNYKEKILSRIIQFQIQEELKPFKAEIDSLNKKNDALIHIVGKQTEIICEVCKESSLITGSVCEKFCSDVEHA